MCMGGGILCDSLPVWNKQKFHIVRVKEGEDFFAVGNNIFTETRPLRLLYVKQNQQLKLKVLVVVVVVVVVVIVLDS